MKLTLLHPEARAPRRAHPTDAGLDLYACEHAVVNAGQTALVSTGVAVQLDPGMVAYVCSRSGMAAKHAVFVLNAPGVIDEGFTGPIGVILHNVGFEPFYIKPGDRIAQLVVQSVLHPVLDIVDSLEATQRGANGFGSTGNG